MPAKTIKKAVAPRARKGVKRRGPEHNAVRQRRPRTEAPDVIIADSLFRLRLPSKKGAEVFFELEGWDPVKHKEIPVMYKELYASYERIYLSAKDGQPTCDISSYLDMPTGFQHMLNQLSTSLLPSGYGFNIEMDEKCKAAQQYFFTIYHKCDWGMHWHRFEIGPTVLRLEKTNKRLLNLFISFLKAFRGCGVYLWTGGFMGGTLDYVSGLAEEYRECGEVEAADEIDALMMEYEKGAPARYNKLIQNAKTLKPSEMRRRAKLFKRDPEIANLIHQGSVIIEKGFNLAKYNYDPSPPEDGYDFWLDLCDQCNIVWSYYDYISEEHGNTLDAQADEGQVQTPVFHRAITSKSRLFNFSEFIDEIRWPGQLCDFFDTANDLIDQYTKRHEQLNRKSRKRI